MSLLVMFQGTANAQFGALKKAINKQIDHKIDSAVDKKAQENKDQQAANQGIAQGDQSPKKNVGLFGGKIDIKYKDNYDFTGRIYMVMEVYDKKDAMKSDYYAYFNEGSKDVGAEMQTVDPKDKNTVLKTAFIFDNDNKAFMTLLSMDSKIGTISKVPSDSALAAQTKNINDKKKPVITKTGNSKVIAGYKCDEYKVQESGEDGYSMVWMTKDLKLSSDTRYWGNSGVPSYYGYPGFEGAVMLAMDGYNKNNELSMKMETKEISQSYKHTISTVGYTFTKLNFGQGRPAKK